LTWIFSLVGVFKDIHFITMLYMEYDLLKWNASFNFKLFIFLWILRIALHKTMIVLCVPFAIKNPIPIYPQFSAITMILSWEEKLTRCFF
jgi:hypothetical protein